jgi:hypothetical protein
MQIQLQGVLSRDVTIKIITRAVVALTVLYITSIIFSKLLGIAIVFAALVLGAMFAKTLKSIHDVMDDSLFGQLFDRQQNCNMSIINEANRPEQSGHDSSNIGSKAQTEKNDIQQERENIVPSKYKRCIVNCAIYIVSHTLVFALAYYLNISLIVWLAYIGSAVLYELSSYTHTDNIGYKHVRNVADAVETYALDAANNISIKNTIGFVCGSIEQVCSYSPRTVL